MLELVKQVVEEFLPVAVLAQSCLDLADLPLGPVRLGAAAGLLQKLGATEEES